MILADKIIQLRKKNGWSQEELAHQLNVSRQAVSKWEGAQAIPDLSKILAMSQLFGVTTDYLLKDGMEAEESTQQEENLPLRRVTLREAGDFLSWRDRAALLIALAVMLCILGVIALLGFGAAGSYASLGLNGNMANGLGLGLLLLFAAAGVILFMYCGYKNKPYEFLDTEEFDTEYGVEGLARKKRQDGQRAYAILNCAGVALCVLSPVSIMAGGLIGAVDFMLSMLLCLTLLLAGGGAALCIVAGVRRAAADKLLKQGEYSAEGKRISRVTGPVSTAYWLLATAIYLAWSFLGQSWEISWVVWPVAGVLFAAVLVLCRALAGRKAP